VSMTNTDAMVYTTGKSNSLALDLYDYWLTGTGYGVSCSTQNNVLNPLL